MLNKSVAIMTYHRAYNYGAALQAYATVKYLKDAGLSRLSSIIVRIIIRVMARLGICLTMCRI